MDGTSFKNWKLFFGLVLLVIIILTFACEPSQSLDMVAKYHFVKDDLSRDVSQFRAKNGEVSLSFETVLQLLQDDPDFVSAFLEVLRNGNPNFKAYFFETPPLTEAQISRPFEFVIVNSPTLARVKKSDVHSFQEHFNLCSKDVVQFYNLRRDAKLVTPCPKNMPDNGCYAHLAKFVRLGDEIQIREFWRTVAQAMRSRVKDQGDQPVWLSTSGLGVYWLHVRLDSFPKYYTFDRYKNSGQ